MATPTSSQTSAAVSAVKDDKGLRAGDLVTVFGGSGFVGRYLVRALAAQGYRVRVAVRRPNEALFLRPMGDVGQVQPVQANIKDAGSCARAMEGAKAVVNLVGILNETGTQSFDELQSMGAGRLAKLAAEAGITRFVQMSAIGADADSASAYARTKGEGEAAVMSMLPTAMIVRPSIIFGPEDAFFNRFAAMATIAPALPLIGGGKTLYQPVYVKDVAKAITLMLGSAAFAGKTLELGGPETASFRDLMAMVLDITARRKPLVTIPFALAHWMAWLTQWIPGAPLTTDQVELLKHDNIVADGALTMSDLGMTATPMATVLPSYLYRFRKMGQFAKNAEA